MPIMEHAQAANLGSSVSEIFNEQYKKDKNQNLAVASIIGQNPNYNREPAYWLFVFNISNREFIRHRPPDFPRIQIKACPKGEPYIAAVKIPDIIQYKWLSPETGNPVFDSIRGERFATDLINPANLGEQMWNEITNPELTSMHGGTDDLSRRGIFWSRNEIPTAEELGRSRAKMEQHYRSLVQQADKLSLDPKTISEIGEEHHIAAEFLSINSSWHVRTVVQEPCPNCSDMINPKAAYHASSIGGICVLDWKRTVSSGVKSRADVPEEFRWWEEAVKVFDPGDLETENQAKNKKR